MKTAITIWVLTTENTEGLGVTVDTFADYESAKKKMEEIVHRFVDYDKECNVWGTDVFRAIVQRNCTSHISIHPQTVEIEVPAVAPNQKMWMLTDEIGDSSVLIGVYANKVDAYNEMCADFKYECDAAVGKTPFDASIGEASATFEPKHGEWHTWKIEPITPATGGTGK